MPFLLPNQQCQSTEGKDLTLNLFIIINVAVFCRHVFLPEDIAKLVPRTHLMTETEWRNLGVQQSIGWVHYMVHDPGSFVRTISNILHCLLLF